VLYSLSGQEIQALNIIEADKVATAFIYYTTGGTPYMVFNLDFGRWLFDPELVLLPGNFSNLQLKITWNEVTWDASCSAHAFIIYGHVFDEKAISPIGFLMNKEIKSYTGQAAGYEYTDLPTDHVIRKLMLQGWRKQYTVRNIIETIKLSEDNDKRVPINGDIYELRGFLDPLAGECSDLICLKATTGGLRAYCTPGQFYNVVGNTDNATDDLQITGLAGNTFVAVTAAGTKVCNLRVRGRNPHNCFGIPFGDQKDLADWYDVAGLGNLKLRIKGGGGAASGSTNIVTQQLRRY